ncbi:UDP-glucose 4-epimerase GalE [Maricaulaceae bacterium NA33B04]|nr:UDP-glucose 4-epimerase GalE [Maricaulaceae bacterium NA33B04]
MATILVTGGAGYIGAHVCKALAARGDIRSADDLDATFEAHAPDAVMHFAANIEVGEGQRFPLRFWDNNVSGAVTLLGAMERAGVKPLVFSSSCAVYGEPEIVPITENESCKPVSVYGQTKRSVEQLLDSVALVDGVRYAALRYFHAAGASPDGEIGEEHDPETHLIPNALKAAAGIGGQMKLYGTDYDTRDGTCIRDYVHVMDLADAHLAALDNLLAGERKLIANLGTGHGASVLEVLQAVERVTGLKPPYEVQPRRPGDAPILSADISYAREMLGFDPQHSDIEQIIEDAWRFHKAAWKL